MLDLRQAARALGGDIAGRDQAIRDLSWWAAAAERNGSDWRGVLLTVLRNLGVIEPCPICECEPCPTPSFCQLAREADRNRERERQQHRKLSPRSTPRMTVEAVKQAVRDGGL